jgi:hypothetical protein
VAVLAEASATAVAAAVAGLGCEGLEVGDLARAGLLREELLCNSHVSIMENLIVEHKRDFLRGMV